MRKAVGERERIGHDERNPPRGRVAFMNQQEAAYRNTASGQLRTFVCAGELPDSRRSRGGV